MNGANINAASDNGATALYAAADKGHLEVVQVGVEQSLPLFRRSGAH